MEEWLSQMTPEKIPGFNIALEIVTGIAVIIGFLVIFQSMYTAVLERTREIGILKSMGASKADDCERCAARVRSVGPGRCRAGHRWALSASESSDPLFPDAAFRDHRSLGSSGQRR